MKRLSLLLAGLLPLLSQGAWIDPSGNQLRDTESMRSSGDFGVQLVLTPDDKKFRQAWGTRGTPKLASTNTVQPGSSVSAMLIFHGCAPNPAGVCDLVAEFVVQSPDGARTPAGGGPVWSDAPSRPGFSQLGLTSITVGFDPTEPLGDYKIEAHVRDKVSGRTLSLVQKLKLAK